MHDTITIRYFELDILKYLRICKLLKTDQIDVMYLIYVFLFVFKQEVPGLISGMLTVWPWWGMTMHLLAWTLIYCLRGWIFKNPFLADVMTWCDDVIILNSNMFLKHHLYILHNILKIRQLLVLTYFVVEIKSLSFDILNFI